MNQKTADALAELWNTGNLCDCSDRTVFTFMNTALVNNSLFSRVYSVKTKYNRRRRIEQILEENGFELVWEDE